MRKRTKRAPAFLSARLVALATLLLIGGAVGSYFAANMSNSIHGYMLDYIVSGQSFSLSWQTVGLELALLLAVFLSAFFRAGFIVPYIVMSVKGFMLSMLITSFVGAFGAAGFFAALPALLLSGFVPVACLVLISLQASGITAERLRAGRGARIFVDKSFFAATGLCAAVTTLSAVAHIYLTPLLSRVAISIT